MDHHWLGENYHSLITKVCIDEQPPAGFKEICKTFIILVNTLFIFVADEQLIVFTDELLIVNWSE